jgi:transcriptional regulator with XRE-family HTH domain
MLSELLSSIEAPAKDVAGLIGVSPLQLDEWAHGRKDIPESIRRRLASLFGISPEKLTDRNISREEAMRQIPPLWKKLRAAHLPADATTKVAAVRLLAARYDEALRLTSPLSDRVKDWIEGIRRDVDPQEPSGRQGELAAGIFLDVSNLGHGARGIGEVFRSTLRTAGLVVLESPVSAIGFEGFCIPVGPTGKSRPCLFANSYKTTWFRRNYVLLHELAHAIFDLESSSAIFDLAERGDDPGREQIAE